MDRRENLLIVKGEDKTDNAVFCKLISNKLYIIGYKSFNGDINQYRYKIENVKYYQNPDVIDLNKNIIFDKNGKEIYNIKYIAIFSDSFVDNNVYVEYDDNKYKYYKKTDLIIKKNILKEGIGKNIFEYLKELSKLNKLSLTDFNGETITSNLGEVIHNWYSKINYVDENSPFGFYLDRNNFSKEKNKNDNLTDIVIFPFGCNKSQYIAVNNALNNKISLIEGPPGTGKTQTILNILSNILLNNKTAIVVSNNNSAIANVYEKLEKYNLDFLVAYLGSIENKEKFIAKQDEKCPDFKEFNLTNDEIKNIKNSILEKNNIIKKVYDKIEKLSIAKMELSQIEIEKKYFDEKFNTIENNNELREIVKCNKSKKVYSVWEKLKFKITKKEKTTFLDRLIIRFFNYIKIKDFFKISDIDLMLALEYKYYIVKLNELEKSILDNELYLKNKNIDELINTYILNSNKYLFNHINNKYSNREREIFSLESLKRNSKQFLDEYPIVLSTTFSAANSLGLNCKYDYLIMDEASQVDICTGALAMNVANNVVVVGDLKQLPNIVTNDDKLECDKLIKKYDITKEYFIENSFMKSISDSLKPPITLLKEHYRCHPKIIEFCNLKFYNNELVVMTSDDNNENSMEAHITAKGNFDRDHYSERQIDIILKEILPKLEKFRDEDIGIIAPYNNQVLAIKNRLQNRKIEVDTVHKFQGREKDVIILSTVDDIIGNFVDNANLLNVAISRAKKKFVIIVSGNEQRIDSNISDLVSYINYNNFKIVNSKISSVFDLLYKQYTNDRIIYLSRYEKISDYDSENIMYTLIKNIFEEYNICNLDVVIHYPLRNLILTNDIFDSKEISYIKNKNTHLDFLIFNKYDKKPILAIEVDGYDYHKLGTKQSERDELKNGILNKMGLDYLRFKTNGSCEKEKIINKLVKNTA